MDYIDRKYFKYGPPTRFQMDSQKSRDVLKLEDLPERALEYHHRDELQRGEYEALMNMGADLVGTPMSELNCLVLGSYDEEANEKQKLTYLQDEIDSRSDGYVNAYLLEDYPDGLHPKVKFQILADYSDYLVGICEHDHGGFQLELGMLITQEKYFNRSYLLKRTYSEEKEHEKYNWMLDRGAFEMFDYAGRLRTWEDKREFRVEAATLISELFE